jgi:hypothetical protein
MNLTSYAELFAHHDLDSLHYVARITPEQIRQLYDEHEEAFPMRGDKGVLGGLVELQAAIDHLNQPRPKRWCGFYGGDRDPRTLPMSQRLDLYEDCSSAGLSVFLASNSVEVFFSVPLYRGLLWIFASSALVLYFRNIVWLDGSVRDFVEVPLRARKFAEAHSNSAIPKRPNARIPSA